MQQCSKCSSSKIENGSLVRGVDGMPSIGRNYSGILYRSPGDSKNNVTFIYASACLNCGHVELYLDPQQLRK